MRRLDELCKRSEQGGAFDFDFAWQGLVTRDQEGKQMPTKKLPPLEVGQAYEAADFVSFEYFGAVLTGRAPILRLHLKNGTTIDLPTTDDELRHLMYILCDAFPPAAVELFRQRGWI